ncbi:hypothetical protein AB0L06_10850 [Spirillospora sp. NPDC052269]
MGGPHRGVFRALTRTRAFTAAAVCCVLLSTAVMPAATGRSRADAAMRRPVIPATTPGMPGVPQPPKVAFYEDFENRQSTLPIRLTSYTGTSGMTYTAELPWLQNCNGWIAAYDDPAGGNAAVAPQVADCDPQTGPGTPGAQAWNHVRQLAQSLGVLNQTNPTSANHAVSAYTNGHVNSGNPGPNHIEFQTGHEIPFAGPNGRFLATSLNVSETSCDVNPNHALLNLYLTQGATDTPVTSRPIDACANGPQISPGFWAGTFMSDMPMLYSGTSVGIKMTNAQGSGAGNDHAFDDVKLLDVTPQLDKEFMVDTAQATRPVQLLFTITNTDDLLAKKGWSFTDTLPPGMKVAYPANAGTDCPAGIVNANPGDTQVSLTEGLLNAGQASCRFAVDVTSDAAGTFLNNASNMTQLFGLNPPGESTVTFTEAPAPSIGILKDAVPDNFTGANQTINYHYRVTNTGNTTLISVGVKDDLPGLSSITCDTTVLGQGQSTDCTATYTTTQQDVDNGYVHNVAYSYGNDPVTLEPAVSSPADNTIRAPAEPSIGITKEADPDHFDGPGQGITYRYYVTNSGNVTLTNVGVADDLDGMSPVTCQETTLAPGQSTLCTAGYVTTQQDMDAGSVHNSAIAHGFAPGATDPTVSPPADVTILTTANPAIEVVKSADPMTFSAPDQIIMYQYHVTNTGNVTLDNVGINDPLPGLSGVTCDRQTLAPNESTDCHAYYGTTQGDLNNGSIKNSATALGTAPGATEPTESGPSSVTVTAEANPGITVAKSADPDSFSAADQDITYSYHVTNTGNVTLDNVGITDDLPGLSGATCGQTSLAPGASTDCTATYRTTQADVDAGSLHNSATAHGTPPGGTEIESPPSEVTILATATPDITVMKTADRSTYSSEGETIAYGYLVTNTGNVTLDNVGITDDLPGLSSISCDATTLAPGQSTDCHATYTVTLQDLLAGSIHNTATSHGFPPGASAPIESAPSEATVNAVINPELTIQKTADPTSFSAAGQNITYSYHVTNGGNVPLTNVGVTDDLNGLPPVTCATTTLNPGESTDCSAVYITTQADMDRGSIYNVATAHGTPPNGVPIESGPSEATVLAVPNPALSLTKSADPPSFSAAGQDITYSYHVTNDGNVTLDGISITDDLPGVSTATCAQTTLAPGETTDCTATYRTTQHDVDFGAVYNVATAHGVPPGATVPIDSPPADLTIYATANPAITVQKTADPMTYSAPGQTITYGYNVTNTGNVTLDNIGIADDLPGVSTATCQQTILAPGVSTDCHATYVITQDDLNNGSVHNTATAHGTAPGATVPTESGPSDVTVTAESNPGITVAKSADPMTYSAPGQTITYGYNVTNTGNVTLNNVGITDGLPGLSAITCNTTTLAPGEGTDCTATYTTTQADVDAGSIHNSATAHGTPPTGGPIESPPSDVTISSTANPAITVRKTAEPTTFSAVGDTITYGYHVTNDGNVTLDNVGIADDLPGVSAATCQQTTLAPDESTDCTATYTTTLNDLINGQIRNVATAHGTAPGATQPTESEPSEAIVYVASNPEITLEKSADPTTYSAPGQTITYTYHLTNSGNVPLGGVGVVDNLQGLSAVTCGLATLNPGETTDCVATYVTSQQDVDNGSIFNVATAHGTAPSATAPTESAPADATVTATTSPGITLLKTADPMSYSAPGETITYGYHVTNDGNVTLNDIGITDDLPGVSTATCPVTSLAPGESTDCTATYTTTQQDVNNGSIHNTATAHGTPSGAPVPIESGPSDVTVTADVNPSITVQKSAAPDSFSAADQTITYGYHVTNTGNVPLTGVAITDNLPGLSAVTCGATTLDPGGSTDCSATYTTTQADVDAGSITNSATAQGTPPTGGPIDSPPSDVTISAAANPAITVEKSASPMTYSAPGQTITYQYNVTNTGNVTLDNVGITDDLPGVSTATCPSTTLAPGQSTNCSATYVTSQQDLNDGSIHNTATSHGTAPGATVPTESGPSDVTVTAIENPGITIAKSADPMTYSAPGQTITYAYRVTNTGNVPLTGVGITDNLPGLSAVTCDLTTLDPDQATDCRATYTTTQADVDAGAINNSATAHGTAPHGTIESPPSEITIFSPANPAITLEKSADPTTYSAAGETITYGYHVTNTGNVTLDNVGITDDLPGVSEATCQATTLAPGESTDCAATYLTTQQDVLNGSIRNVATARGTAPGATAPTESGPSDVTVTLSANPGITVQKTADPMTFSAASQTITYGYRVTNTGNVPLTGVGITDDLPGVATATCAATTLNPGESTDCSATYTTTQADVDAGSIHNSATAHGTPPTGGPIESPPSDVTVLATAAPAIQLLKTADPLTYSAPGQTIRYTYQVSNTGNVTLDSVGITDDLPGVSAAVCPQTTLAPGATTDCSATYVTTQGDLNNGSIHNTAIAHGTAPGATTPTESAPSDATVYAVANPGITVAKSADPMTFSAAGQTITYTYRVTNTGNLPLTSVGITDDLPGVSAVTCDLTTLNPGQSTDCTAAYQVTQQDMANGSIRNSATAHGTPPGATTPTESEPSEVTVTVAHQPSISVRKSADPATFSAAGQTITYGYRVTNTGNELLTSVGITDALPGVSAVTCDLTTLDPGQSTDCAATYTTTQQDVANGSITNSATAHGTTPEGEPIESPPSEVTVEIEAIPAITVTKSAAPTTFSAAGETITYGYRVTNTGNVPLTSIGITDNLPGLSAVTCQSTTLALGEGTDCAATYVTTQADVDAGSITNSATAQGTAPGATEPTESEPSEVTVHAGAAPTAGITVRKSAAPTTFSQAGQEIRYSYRVTNTGEVPLTDVGVTDQLHGLSGVTCPRTTLAPGDSETCTATYTTTQDDVNRGSIRNVATAHGTPPGATTPTQSGPSEATVHGTTKPGLTIHKKVRPKTFSKVGQTLHYSYRVTNTGTVALDNVRIEDKLHGLSAIRCPKRNLAPRESMTCTATYRIRAKDLRSLVVRNRAIAKGTPPASRVPVASRPAKVVAYGHVPVTG